MTEKTPEEIQKDKRRAGWRAWARANPDKWRPQMERRRLKRVYGVTPEEVQQMRETQNYCCAICGEKRKLVIDHCHETRKVRALLCVPCNAGLGAFRDTPALFRAAVKYLALHAQKQKHLPRKKRADA